MNAASVTNATQCRVMTLWLSCLNTWTWFYGRCAPAEWRRVPLICGRIHPTTSLAFQAGMPKVAGCINQPLSVHRVTDKVMLA